MNDIYIYIYVYIYGLHSDVVTGTDCIHVRISSDGTCMIEESALLEGKLAE